MNFYLVLCKQRKKIDKYIKINRVRNKVIIDIKQMLEEEDLNNVKFKDYFNLLVFTKITHTFKKCKDVYYIPNYNENMNIKELFRIKEAFPFNIKFNILLFYDEYKDDEIILKDLFDNMDIFDASQIIKDY